MISYVWDIEQPIDWKKASLVEYVMGVLGGCLERQALFKVPQRPPGAVRAVYAEIASKYGHSVTGPATKSSRVMP